MLGRFINKNIVKIAIGVPIVLLLLSLALVNTTSDLQTTDSRVNTYLNPMPTKYVDAYNKNKENDSTFFCAVVQGYATRELIVLKQFPTDYQKTIDFTVELYSSNLKNNKGFITFDIKNDAAVYGHDDKTYAVFKKALPFIDVEKLIVKKRAWQHTLEKPFSLKTDVFDYQTIAGKNVKSAANPYNRVFTDALKKHGITFLPYSYAIEQDSLFQVNTDVTTFVNETNQTIGTVAKENEFWSLVNKKHTALSNSIVFDGKESQAANNLIESFINEEIPIESVFNIKKLIDFIALKNAFSNNCDATFYVLYNPTDNLLEPFFTQSNCIGLMAKNTERPKIDNANFLASYIKALDEVSKTNFQEILVNENKTFENELGFINKYEPTNVFDLDAILINQKIIKKSLNATSLVIPELISFKNRKFKIAVANNSIFPVNIFGLYYQNNKLITSLNPIPEIQSGEKDTVVIDVPRSFENLFVSKKNKQAGFNLYKDIYDLRISYSTASIYQIHYASIYPFEQEKNQASNDLMRIKSTCQDRTDIIINEENKTIEFSKKSVTIASPLIIPSGYQFNIKEGTLIDIVDGGKIISHAPLNFKGTDKNPIKISSSDKKGQGLLVLSEGKESNLEHVIIDGLGNPKQGFWNITGAVTFYESPVNLLSVTISNNRCEDALNIVRTTFNMNNCDLNNTQSDAFDGDFVTGTIINSQFNKLGNDAIDVSGSDLKISHVKISNAGDKGLSAGEDSRMVINDVEISNSEIAIAGKDLSIVEAKNLKIINTKLGFTAFQKKPEFGPSNITVTAVVMEGVETKYLIENTSSMIVDGEKIETSENVKDRMYGVEFGVSSEDTKNSQ